MQGNFPRLLPYRTQHIFECLSSNILDWETDPIILRSHLAYLAFHLAWGHQSFPLSDLRAEGIPRLYFEWWWSLIILICHEHFHYRENGPQRLLFQDTLMVYKTQCGIQKENLSSLLVLTRQLGFLLHGREKTNHRQNVFLLD